MTAMQVLRRALGACALFAGIGLSPSVASAQYEIGLGFHIANTNTNALGLGATLNWRPAAWFQFRTFLDAERGQPDFKEGLEYDKLDRYYIVDQSGIEQNPIGDELWQGQGWDLHAAAYATLKYWKIAAGPGLAYNGHDGSPTSGPAFAVIGEFGTRTELDVEFLQGDSWRFRVSVSFWTCK